MGVAYSSSDLAITERATLSSTPKLDLTERTTPKLAPLERTESKEEDPIDISTPLAWPLFAPLNANNPQYAFRNAGSSTGLGCDSLINAYLMHRGNKIITTDNGLVNVRSGMTFLTLGGYASSLDYYETGVIAASTDNSCAIPLVSAPILFVRTGANVTLQFSELSGIIQYPAPIKFSPIPNRLTPVQSVYTTLWLNPGDYPSYVAGVCRIDPDGSIVIGPDLNANGDISRLGHVGTVGSYKSFTATFVFQPH
jgi:hypothetical protein